MQRTAQRPVAAPDLRQRGLNYRQKDALDQSAIGALVIRHNQRAHVVVAKHAACLEKRRAYLYHQQVALADAR